MSLPRLWPDGIAARIALTLIMGLLAVQAISTLAFVVVRPELRQPLRPQEMARHLAAAVELVEAAPAAERPAVAAELDGPLLRVAWSPERPGLAETRSGRGIERFRHHLQVLLRDRDRPVLVDTAPPAWLRVLGFDERPDGRYGAARPAGRHARIAVALADGGGWLLFSVADPDDAAWRLVRFGLWMLLIAGAVIGLSLWAAYRITAPLARFAAAAERLGLDTAAAPLPEAGPRELRAATRAVNRMQERLKRFVEDRTRMVAAIGHDLRTPLTRLRLRAEFVDDPEQQRKMLADLAEMEAMLAATLAFARDDAAQEPRTPADLADLLQSLCEGHSDAGDAVAYEGPARFTYACRPLALKRAFGNLIYNAVKYGGGARVRLAPPAEAAAESLVVTVADDGPGIPESQHEKVFAPFFRLEESRSRDTGGVGLGLSVARSIIRGHGGDVTLANRPEGGLTVTVTLPR